MIPTLTNLEELCVSNDLLGNPEGLQDRISEDGYLFFRQLQDPAMLLELRRQMLTTMQEGGWIKQGTDPLEGIAEPGVQCTEGDPEYTDVYHQVYRNQLFHESAHSEMMLRTVSDITGRQTIPQPQKVARLWFPKYTAHTTPIHQDFVHFQGTYDNLTCWSPVGDCPIELGGLAVLKGSHKVGTVLEHHFSLGAGSLMIDQADYDALGLPWQTTNYEIGDTLIFPALTMHMALPNVTEDRLRVSLDNRYQAVDDPIAEHMTEPHLAGMSAFGWRETYEAWDSEEYQYYWKDLGLKVIPKDFSFANKGFDEACELARSGHEEAVHHLARLINQDPDTEQSLRAQEILAQL
ncbi:MAG: phytanoyl-CoA dioxygenase family protein [Pirellulaceae bacterium]|nr:phytanoyl-CoA dioxygenase family protein [Pirellulaceae bacterium]